MSDYPYGAPVPDGLGDQGDEGEPTQVRSPEYETSQQHRTDDSSGGGAESGGRHGRKGGHKGPGGLRAALIGLVGGVVGAGALVAVLMGCGVIGTTSTTTSSGTTASQTVVIDPDDDDITTATAVAAKALPSVVTVSVTTSSGSGTGSGVILDTDGNIITNYHVIESAQEISVTIEGVSYSATVVGSDSSSDLAVVKAELNGATVTPIEVGSSSELQVGDWVMTIGSPFGLDQSVSTGIVSALYRDTLMTSTSGNTLYTNLIQTDASINPGNSGGALVNSEGQLVGICTLYSSSTESSANVGFAIPSDYAIEVAEKIIAGETVTHAYIGLTMQTVNATNARTNSLSVTQGAYITEVAEGSPAEEAGIQAGDILISLGGDAVTSADGAILKVRSHSIGETVEVVVVRDGEEITLEVTLGSDEALQEQLSSSTTQNDSSVQELIERLQEINGNGSGSGSGPMGR